jgi:hypothetical protein
MAVKVTTITTAIPIPLAFLTLVEIAINGHIPRIKPRAILFDKIEEINKSNNPIVILP